jgi:hypothetical protein
VHTAGRKLIIIFTRDLIILITLIDSASSGDTTGVKTGLNSGALVLVSGSYGLELGLLGAAQLR